MFNLSGVVQRHPHCIGNHLRRPYNAILLIPSVKEPMASLMLFWNLLTPQDSLSTCWNNPLKVLKSWLHPPHRGGHRYMLCSCTGLWRWELRAGRVRNSRWQRTHSNAVPFQQWDVAHTVLLPDEGESQRSRFGLVMMLPRSMEETTLLRTWRFTPEEHVPASQWRTRAASEMKLRLQFLPGQRKTAGLWIDERRWELRLFWFWKTRLQDSQYQCFWRLCSCRPLSELKICWGIINNGVTKKLR